MKYNASTRNRIILVGAALGFTAGALVKLGRYVSHEIERRGYPSWDTCHCNFKDKQTIFLVCYSRNGRRGATIVSQEWGVPLSNAPAWLRRFLHHSAQVFATLNPGGHFVERVVLSPQEARQFAVMLRAALSDEELVEEEEPEESYIIWRQEVLHVPRRAFDPYIRRLYPVNVPQERKEQVRPLPVLWDPSSNLPIPSEGALLDTEAGTRIDYIGWTPSQISYCTARTY